MNDLRHPQVGNGTKVERADAAIAGALVPAAENGDVAIVRAVVRMEEGKFAGIGDASPQNVGRMIAPHLIRMAETRAKARALRDAIKVGVTAFEELGGEEEAVESPRGSFGDGRQAKAQAEVHCGSFTAAGELAARVARLCD